MRAQLQELNQLVSAVTLLQFLIPFPDQEQAPLLIHGKAVQPVLLQASLQFPEQLLILMILLQV